jgi:two-component system sensor histidine kinase UhpB
MSLRLKVNLIVGAVMALLVLTGIALQLQAVRRSVSEEIVATNRVTVQLLSRVSFEYGLDNPDSLVRFFSQLGRVRANDITLVSATGEVLYRSPPSRYKEGREAPEWFTALMLPPTSRQVLQLPGHGAITIESEPSRAILDGWDDLVRLASIAALALVLIQGLVFWAVSHATQPFARIVQALNRLQGGDFDTQLPRLPGREARTIGDAFNRMVGVLREQMDNRQRAYEAERQLRDARELAGLIERQMDAERRSIAKALHDEFAQSVTAIRSLARTLELRCGSADHTGRQAARCIDEEAARLYDQMHGMIPRLAPSAPDSVGLGDALADLLQRTRAAHPGVQVELQLAPALREASGATAELLYRVAQEGVTNAIRHGGARCVRIELRDQPQPLALVSDDGRGSPASWRGEGHFGLRWLADRAEALGGHLLLRPATPRGTVLEVSLPAAEAAPLSSREPA